MTGTPNPRQDGACCRIGVVLLDLCRNPGVGDGKICRWRRVWSEVAKLCQFATTLPPVVRSADSADVRLFSRLVKDYSSPHLSYSTPLQAHKSAQKCVDSIQELTSTSYSANSLKVLSSYSKVIAQHFLVGSRK